MGAPALGTELPGGKESAPQLSPQRTPTVRWPSQNHSLPRASSHQLEEKQPSRGGQEDAPERAGAAALTSLAFKFVECDSLSLFPGSFVVWEVLS